MTLEDAAAFVENAGQDDRVVGFVLTFMKHGEKQVSVWVFRIQDGILIEEYLK